MNDKEAARQLKLFVKGLSERELKKLAAKIELDRGENRFGIPHNAIMALLRPKLAEIRAPRVCTPQRALCLPFEDMLVFEDPGTKEAGKIARASIIPMWNLLTWQLAPDEMKDLGQRYIEAQKEDDSEARRRIASEMWALAADRLLGWIAQLDEDRMLARKASKSFGGSRRIEDFREMAYVLDIADIVEDAKSKLPRKPIPSLDQRHVTILKQFYDEVADEKPGREAQFVLVMMARLLQPFPIFKLFRALSRKLDDALTAQSDLAVAGDIVIKALEADAQAVVDIAGDPKAADEDQVIARARRFANAFKNITKDIGIRRDGEWGQRMYKSRNIVSNAVDERILSNASEYVLAVLPKRDGAPWADFSDFPDEDLFEIAERRARAVGEANKMADQIGLQSGCQLVVGKLRKDLEKYTGQIIEMLPKVGPERKKQAAAHLFTAVRLVELITNSETADLLRRRGNAALYKRMVT